MKRLPKNPPGISLAMLILVFIFPVQAAAYETGEWVVRGGALYMSPQVSNFVVQSAPGGPDIYPVAIDFSNETQLGINATYMISDNVGAQVLTATPFYYSIVRTSITDPDAMNATPGYVYASPFSISLQLYFMDAGARTQPYVGLGANYTTFYNPKVSGAQNDAIENLEVDDTWGLSFEVGIDVAIDEHWVVNAAAWYISSETQVSFSDYDDNWTIDDVDLNPLAFMLGVGYRF